jgi:hypothetical protein
MSVIGKYFRITLTNLQFHNFWCGCQKIHNKGAPFSRLLSFIYPSGSNIKTFLDSELAIPLRDFRLGNSSSICPYSAGLKCLNRSGYSGAVHFSRSFWRGNRTKELSPGFRSIEYNESIQRLKLICGNVKRFDLTPLF